MKALNAKALVSLPILILIMAALIFIPAGTLDYWQAWGFLGVYFASSLAITLYLMKKDPRLLQRRMRGGPAAEKQMSQKVIMSLTSLGFVALLVVPALDHRFAWSHMSAPIALLGDTCVALGFLGIWRVFKENTYTSSTIELAADQRVISSGPYALVRHPMYAAASGMLIGISIALGSYVGLIIIVAISGALIWRLLDEEKFLAANLSGYVEYQKRVPYRLIPGIW
ncbi:MAG TPA: isoprenylcysteine carboxylmethyltransferase family protein [Steroidobacteraceae bacterium]|jgi:protein-S-isoprenylcysteine O-methyltransferase Ste14